MNEKSAPQAPANNVNSAKTINDWLIHASHELTKANIPTARLDSEVLLGYMLGVDRTWLIAHANDSLTLSALSQKGGERRSGLKEYGDKLVLRRLKREPIAYIIGKKEFYGREFIVSPHVLIPRPESELIIEILLELSDISTTGRLLDVGTGSGCLAITAKLERPKLEVVAVDIDSTALDVASANAKRLKTKILAHPADLTRGTSGKFSYILANLPYVDRGWERSPETNHEPALALFADNGGLEFIYQLIDQSPSILTENGYLLLEADPEQHSKIIANAKEHGFRLHESRDYIVVLQKS